MSHQKTGHPAPPAPPQAQISCKYRGHKAALCPPIQQPPMPAARPLTLRVLSTGHVAAMMEISEPCVPALSLITSVTRGDSSSPTCRTRSLRGGGGGELACFLLYFLPLGFFVSLVRPHIEPTVRPCSAGTPGSIRLQGHLGFRPGDLCGTSTYTHVVGGRRTTTCRSAGRAHVFPRSSARHLRAQRRRRPALMWKRLLHFCYRS